MKEVRANETQRKRVNRELIELLNETGGSEPIPSAPVPARTQSQLERSGNVLAILGIAVVLLVVSDVRSRAAGIAATAAIGGLVLILWYALPLGAAARDRCAR